MTTTTDGSRARSVMVVLGLGGSLVAADVLTKNWAIDRLATRPITLLGGSVNLIETRNPGAAFSLGTSVTPLLTCIALAAVLGIIAASTRTTSVVMASVLALLLGGAGGNLVDRIFRDPGPFRGHVVDWIDVGAWPTFNLADSSLVTGLILLLVASLWARPTPDTGSSESTTA